ncbi:unnamed protein product [Ectocarpus sp. 13 AM-2016]
MSGRAMPFQFHTRRPSAVVRQSGPGRSTLHVDLAAAGGATTAAAGAAAARAAARAAAGDAGRGRGAGGWRGRRGWWGSSRRLPDFLEFWGLVAAVPEDERLRRERERRERSHHLRGPVGSCLRSPEFSIVVLGLAALLAFIVFICDMIAGRRLRPISVLVFVAAGTYCLALIKQRRDLAASEQALVIEIMDGSATSSSRRVMSKEDRRKLFDYFTFRPSSSTYKGVWTAVTATQTDTDVEVSAMEQGTAAPTAAAAAAAAAADDDGRVSGVGDGSDRGDKYGSPRSWSLPSPLGLSAPTHGPGGAGSDTAAPPSPAQPLATPPVSPSALALAGTLQGEGAAVAVGGVADDGTAEVLAGVEVVEESGKDEREGVMMLAQSSGAAAGLSPFFSVASGRDEGESAIRGSCCGAGVADSDESGGGRSAVAGPEKRPPPEGEEFDDKEVPERGMTGGLSELWSSGESCIICFGEYAEGDVLCRLPCRHTYHAECIDAWLDGPGHSWCPLCKSSLLPPSEPRNSSDNGETGDGGGTNATTTSADSNTEQLGSPATAAAAAAAAGAAPAAGAANVGDEAV